MPWTVTTIRVTFGSGTGPFNSGIDPFHVHYKYLGPIMARMTYQMWVRTSISGDANRYSAQLLYNNGRPVSKVVRNEKLTNVTIIVKIF